MKSGLVAVIGKANAGKSTLINVLVGEKISIVSPKPQTTRDRILGIRTDENEQIVFVDTPGIYKMQNALSVYMQKSTDGVSREVDIILFVIDAHRGVTDDDLDLLKKYVGLGTKVILALTKIDIMEKERLPIEISKFCGMEGILEIIPVSARKGKNTDELINTIKKHLTIGEFLYSQDIVSDKSEKFMVGEIMREKILLLYDKEIPHGIAIIINKFEKRTNKDLYDVDLDIVCEKTNHKAILIGKNGEALKNASSYARKDMEKFLGSKVFLTVFVKVKEDWRDRDGLIRDFGYRI